MYVFFRSSGLHKADIWFEVCDISEQLFIVKIIFVNVVQPRIQGFFSCPRRVKYSTDRMKYDLGLSLVQVLIGSSIFLVPVFATISYNVSNQENTIADLVFLEIIAELSLLQLTLKEEGFTWNVQRYVPRHCGRLRICNAILIVWVIFKTSERRVPSHFLL
jgi:hypothetical protein